MPITSISGSRLRKMVTQASGTKGYISSSVQKHLSSTQEKRFLRDDSKVTRQQAIRIVKGLKEAGLAHKITSDASGYVKKAFAKEEHRQEMIKKQNLAERNKEIAAEKAAEQNKAGKNPTKTAAPVRHVNLAGNTIPTIGNESRTHNELVGTSFGSTNLKPVTPNTLLKPVREPEPEPEPEPIDLAID